MEMMEGDDGPPLIAEACPESVMDVENEDCRAGGLQSCGDFVDLWARTHEDLAALMEQVIFGHAIDGHAIDGH